MARKRECPDCNGTGVGEAKKCPKCGGSGYIQTGGLSGCSGPEAPICAGQLDDDSRPRERMCSRCDGTGTIEIACRTCKGQGHF